MTDDRAAYTAGLRALADLLDSTPDLPLPSERKMTWQCTEYAPGSAKAEMARIIRLIPGTFIKNDPTESLLDEKYLMLTGEVGGMPVEVWAERDTVCRRIVRWDCVPLLASEATP